MPTINAEQIQELERCVERLERVVEELDTRQPDTIHSLRLSSLKIRKVVRDVQASERPQRTQHAAFR